MSLASELLRHYLEYLSAPTVLLTFCLVLAPLCYGLYDDTKPKNSREASSQIPGCRLLGTTNGSHKTPPKAAGRKRGPRIAALYTYPIDGCKAVQLPASEVANSGLKYDGAFTFAQLASDQTSPNGTSDPRWRPLTARTHPRLASIELSLWVPDPRQRSTKVSNGHTKTGSGDTTVFGMHKPRSRSRQGTLVMESAGQEAERLRKFSVPAAESDLAANGGCLVIDFPVKSGFDPLGFRTGTVSLQIPLQPTAARAEAKGYRDEDLTCGEEFVSTFDLTSEIDPAALESLQSFLGVGKPLALFWKTAIVRDNSSWDVDDVGPLSDSHNASSSRLRAMSVEQWSPPGGKVELDKVQSLRPNVVLEGLDIAIKSPWSRMAFGLCLRPVDQGNDRGRSAARRATSSATYAVTGDPDSLLLRPTFDYGIVRVGDLVEVLDGEEGEEEE